MLHPLSFDKVNLMVTDGAPSMVGKNRGLVSRVKEIAPQMHALHCLIHQSVLCARLSGELKGVMDKVMRVIHFIRGTSSTQHRLGPLLSEKRPHTTTCCYKTTCAG